MKANMYVVNTDKQTQAVIDRFLNFIEETNNCWIWKGATRGNLGVAQFQIKQGTTISARKFAFQLWKGSIDGGRLVQLTCGNNLCVNPEHMILSHGKAPIALNQIDIARFWSKVDRSGGPDACWPWLGGTFSPGGVGTTNVKHRYGLFVACGTNFYAHRVAYAIAHNIATPNDVHVRHKTCDNPLCCNPSHLEPGDAASNAGDKVEHNRQARMPGSANPNSVLTEAQVVEIRTLRSAGMILDVLAKRFKCSIPTVGKICNGDLWPQVGGPITRKFTRMNKRPDAVKVVLTCRWFYRRYCKQGHGGGWRVFLAQRFGISENTVWNQGSGTDFTQIAEDANFNPDAELLSAWDRYSVGKTN